MGSVVKKGVRMKGPKDKEEWVKTKDEEQEVKEEGRVKEQEVWGKMRKEEWRRKVEDGVRKGRMKMNKQEEWV